MHDVVRLDPCCGAGILCHPKQVNKWIIFKFNTISAVAAATVLSIYHYKVVVSLL